MKPGSKIVLTSSDVEDYSETSLRRTISRIVNPRGSISEFLFGCVQHKHFYDFFVGITGRSSKRVYRSDRCPNWWPKDVAPMLGTCILIVSGYMYVDCV